MLKTLSVPFVKLVLLHQCVKIPIKINLPSLFSINVTSQNRIFVLIYSCVHRSNISAFLSYSKKGQVKDFVRFLVDSQMSCQMESGGTLYPVQQIA